MKQVSLYTLCKAISGLSKYQRIGIPRNVFSDHNRIEFEIHGKKTFKKIPKYLKIKQHNSNNSLVNEGFRREFRKLGV